MTALKPYLISAYDVGTEKDLEPWLIPEKAFVSMEDAYTWRGRILKKRGARQIGRLRKSLVVTNPIGTYPASPPMTGTLPLVSPAILIPGTITFSDGTHSTTDDGKGGFAGGGTINYVTGIYSFTLAGATTGSPITVSAEIYPNLPVMGILPQETTSISYADCIAFNTKNAFRFNQATQSFENISYGTDISAKTGPITWNGGDSDFFWGCNYANALFVSNGVDPIRYLALAGGTTEVWRDFTPHIKKSDSSAKVERCLMMVSYRGRLVMINTIESGTNGGNFPQRARWSQNGTPYYNVGTGPDLPPTPFKAQAESWYDDVMGRGGFIDAPTREEALSCAFVRDNLVVYFERSTWMLRYNYDPVNTFVWERVNTDFGSESTFSSVTFDQGVFTVGSYGIFVSDGNTVQRIDQKIPDEVFSFRNTSDAPKRVHGIRNFTKQLVYWTFPNDVGQTYPNRLLVYNYLEGSWSFFIDSYTCFGPFQKNPTFTWNQLTEQTWENFNYSWENPTGQAYAPELAAGNQQGFIMGLDSQITPDSSLYISEITNLGYALQIGSPNHNLEVGQFISFKGMTPSSEPTISVIQSLVWKVISVLDENQIVVENSNFPDIPTFVATYFGEMLILPNVDLVSRRYSFGVGEGYQTRLVRTDFFVDRDETGSFTVQVYPDEDSSIGFETTVSCAAEPPTTLNLAKVWKRDYNAIIGQMFQYHIFFNDQQMYNSLTTPTNFVLHALLIWIGRAGRLTY